MSSASPGNTPRPGTDQYSGHRAGDLELSVVIPVFNEAGGIATLLSEVAAALAGLGATEIIVVDDCSTDDSSERIRDWRRQQQAPLRLLRHRRNRGQSAAVASGVRVARGTWVATLDGDGQNDPADIPALAAHAAAAVDGERLIVCGHRVRRDDSLVKRAASRVANTVRSAILRDDTPDTGCGLKVMRRSLFLELPYFDHMHRFLPALVRQCGGRSVSLPVNHRPRHHGVSKYGVLDRLWAGIIDLAGVVWLGRRRAPTDIEEVDD